jgi:23S rRNA (cytosine1962-C5)-methyltransferase
LERYGKYIFVRPDHRAVWQPALAAQAWNQAHARFHPSSSESGGEWEYRQPVEPTWTVSYGKLRFLAQATKSRHMGFFPEQAVHWDWITQQTQAAKRQIRVLNLFGYTGLATLAAAQGGAHVTHVDAAKRAITSARQNQSLSGLDDRPIRWIVDDAFKFVRREVRRGAHYDGLILDPPKFGRGPSGQVWEFFKSLPELLADCRQLLSDSPRFIIITAYAVQISALSVYYALEPITHQLGGSIETGELALNEKSAGRYLSMALYTRWSAQS